MTIDLGIIRFVISLGGQSDPWYGPLVVAVPLGLVLVWGYYTFLDK
jgi:hypothetical protein